MPYEIIRIDCGYTANETVEEYFQKYQGNKEILQRYEKWCKDNSIELDKNKTYHDSKGKLFDKFFYLEDKK